MFNPEKRLRKALIDITTQLAQKNEEARGDVRRLSLSYPYLALLLVAEQAIRELTTINQTSRYQFLVLVSSGRGKEEMSPVLLSLLHVLEYADMES